MGHCIKVLHKRHAATGAMIMQAIWLPGYYQVGRWLQGQLAPHRQHLKAIRSQLTHPDDSQAGAGNTQQTAI